MTEQQKITMIQTTVKAYLANRQAEYKGRGFTRRHEMEAIKNIKRQMAYVEKLGFKSHCSVVRTLRGDILAIVPGMHESTTNHAGWNQMRKVLKACERRVTLATPVQSKLFKS